MMGVPDVYPVTSVGSVNEESVSHSSVYESALAMVVKFAVSETAEVCARQHRTELPMPLGRKLWPYTPNLCKHLHLRLI